MSIILDVSFTFDSSKIVLWCQQAQSYVMVFGLCMQTQKKTCFRALDLSCFIASFAIIFFAFIGFFEALLYNISWLLPGGSLNVSILFKIIPLVGTFIKRLYFKSFKTEIITNLVLPFDSSFDQVTWNLFLVFELAASQGLSITNKNMLQNSQYKWTKFHHTSYLSTLLARRPPAPLLPASSAKGISSPSSWTTPKLSWTI